MKHESFDESIEMYLKTISELANGDDLIPISILAQTLGVSTVSATEMIHRLKTQSLIIHTRYKGVKLTEKGSRRAHRVVRSHQLWEHFLVGHLGLPWERVHDIACRLEHVTDTQVTEALAAFLGNPETCPHGNPIPSSDYQRVVPNDIPLDQLQPGQRGVIARIHPESTLLLDYLAARDLKPGQEILFEEVAPFNGPVMISTGAQTYALGQRIAAQIFVTQLS